MLIKLLLFASEMPSSGITLLEHKKIFYYSIALRTSLVFSSLSFFVLVTSPNFLIPTTTSSKDCSTKVPKRLKKLSSLD